MHLIRSEGGNLAIDPVPMGDEVLEAITARGVARILITNRNHTRASARAANFTSKRRTRATIAGMRILEQGQALGPAPAAAGPGIGAVRKPIEVQQPGSVPVAS